VFVVQGKLILSIGVIPWRPLEKSVEPMPNRPLVLFSKTRGTISPNASVTIAR
jgi:hypothetical protein